MKNNVLLYSSGGEKPQLLVLADKRGKIKGFAPKEICHQNKGKTHLAFLAVVSDYNGKIFLAKRAKEKPLWPDFWDGTFASHLLPGETPEKAARRRSEEEIGLKMSFQKIGAFYYFASYQKMAENEYCYLLFGKTKKEICPNPKEISQIKKIDFFELKKQIKKREDFFTPWLILAIKKFCWEKYL